MPYIVKSDRYLERDNFGGPLRWSDRKHATAFTKRVAMRLLKQLHKFGETDARVEFVATK